MTSGLGLHWPVVPHKKRKRTVGGRCINLTCTCLNTLRVSQEYQSHTRSEPRPFRTWARSAVPESSIKINEMTGTVLWRNTEARSRNFCCCANEIIYACCEFVFVALCTQHTKRVRCIMLSFVACPAVPCFSTLSHKRQDNWRGGGKLLNIRCVLSNSLQILTYFSF